MKAKPMRISRSAKPRPRVRTFAPPGDPEASAKCARLRYVSDERPGIARKRSGAGFVYVDPRGRRVRNPDVLLRIRSLVIPPAWRNVWICPDERGHIQAVGRDQRGRKQYRYHARWREARDASKYDKMMTFAQALPRIRARVTRDLARPGLPREKVLAAVVRLLETTLVRVGNDEYADANNSYGLTTLRDRHVKITGPQVRLRFKGKSGVAHDIDFADQRLAKIVRKCQELPGEELLQYLDDDGAVRDVGSGDVNDYLREVSGQEFTAKDFRTWAGTVLAAQALQKFEAVDARTAMKKNIAVAIDAVAKRLGNTRTVCRKCYIHPAIIVCFLNGSLGNGLAQHAKKRNRKLSRLRPMEAAVLALLQRHMKADAMPPRDGGRVKAAA